MKLLKIEGKAAHFYVDEQTYRSIETIAKDDLLRLANLTLTQDAIEFDPYSEHELPNQAHQVIYKSVAAKLSALRDRRAEFGDQAARLFLEDYENYKKDISKV